MNKLNLDDTIAAVSTPIGEGGIGIVRLSGKNALAIADRVFASKDGKKPSEYSTYTTHYGHVVDRPQARYPNPITGYRLQVTGYELIDEVLLTVMRAPKSYTKEDIVEINCHGGIAATRKVLELVIREGARLANPGEFTMRAFLNGRIDLAQAEAVLDLIRAKTDEGMRVAVGQLDGGLSCEIKALRDEIIDVLVDLEASIDFPEEGIELKENEELISNMDKIAEGLKSLLDTADYGAILRSGIKATISGKPNVGKSSLLNALSRKDRAIVTPFPGTTRDVIEEVISIKGIPLIIADTAGITESYDPIEKEGISRGLTALASADLVLFVLDGSSPLTREDEGLIEKVRGKRTIAIVNKIDLPQRIELDRLEREFFARIVKISAAQKAGLDELEDAVEEAVWGGGIAASSQAIVTNVRHKNALETAFGLVEEAKSSIEGGASSELVVPSLRDALDALGEIVGETSAEDILRRIFDQFCIGK